MRASLDTNVIIHFYKAGKQDILFNFFKDGLVIYEQIRDIELERHGQDILSEVDKDIASERIHKYTYEELKINHVNKIFDYNYKENKSLYGPGDLGEVYAISLAQTLGMYSLVTDDTKQGGPYMSLLQFEDEIMPFTFADVLIMRFLFGEADAKDTVDDFELINKESDLNWSFKSQLAKFIRRFWKDPYRKDDTIWIDDILSEKDINVKEKLIELSKLL